MKVFLSQPMSGRPREEILKERSTVLEELQKMHGDDIELIRSYFNTEEYPNLPKHPSLYFLGMAIQRMADADMVYFMEGWDKSRGCVIEYECARMYNLDCYELVWKDMER